MWKDRLRGGAMTGGAVDNEGYEHTARQARPQRAGAGDAFEQRRARWPCADQRALRGGAQRSRYAKGSGRTAAARLDKAPLVLITYDVHGNQERSGFRRTVHGPPDRFASPRPPTNDSSRASARPSTPTAAEPRVAATSRPLQPYDGPPT